MTRSLPGNNYARPQDRVSCTPSSSRGRTNDPIPHPRRAAIVVRVLVLFLGTLPGCDSETLDGSSGIRPLSSTHDPVVLSPAQKAERLERLQRARDAFVRGQYETARAQLERCRELDAQDPEVMYQLAKLALLVDSEFEKGRVLLEDAYRQAPADLKIGRLLAETQEMLGLRAEAAWTYLELVEVHPEALEFYLPAARAMGIAIYRMPGDFSSRTLFERRAALLEHVLERRPGHREAAKLLAETYFNMGDFEEAEARYLHCQDLFSKQEQVPGVLGRLLRKIGGVRFRAGRNTAAAAAYVQAIDHGEVDPSVYWNLLLCYPEGYPGDLPPSYRVSIADRSASVLARLKFTDVSHEAHVDKFDGAGPSAWGDIDGDGVLDLFVSGCNTFSAVYLGSGDGTFRDATLEWGLIDLESGFCSILGDYDNDGDPDLYVVRDGWFGPAANSLLRNDGGGRFKDVTERAGVADPKGSGFTASWWDYDRDGLLDLVVANGISGDGSKNTVFRNLGNGQFEDTTETTGLYEADDVRTIGLVCFDYDKDGDVDLFCNGYLCPNRLFRNAGDGTFRNVAQEAGVAGRKREFGYIALAFDCDNDTWPDIVSVQYEHDYNRTVAEFLAGEPSRGRRRHSRLYRNRADGTFEDLTKKAGFLLHGAMGGNCGDIDRDGYVDLYLGTGGPAMDRFEPNALYVNSGLLSFVEVGWPVGVGDVGKGHGVTLCDYDHDGDLDLYSPQGGAYHGDLWTNRLYRNDSPGNGRWLNVKLEGTKSNRDAIGARLTVKAGGKSFYREVLGGTGFGSTNCLEAHFGLGVSEQVDQLRIDWPSGDVQEWSDIPVNLFLTIKEGQSEYRVKP